MKIAIFSDIHRNYTALEVCIKKIEKMNVDTLIWCGDYITDFPESYKVIQLINQCEKKYKCYIISGNREQYIIKFDKIKQNDSIFLCLLRINKPFFIYSDYFLGQTEDIDKFYPLDINTYEKTSLLYNFWYKQLLILKTLWKNFYDSILYSIMLNIVLIFVLCLLIKGL